MNTGKSKVESVRNDLIELNKKFYEKSLLPEAFYKQLMQAGFAYSQCVVISIFPDGSNTYCGKLISQEDSVIEFDVDLDSCEYSSWEDVTDTFRKTYKENEKSKPWATEVVAYDLYLATKNK